MKYSKIQIIEEIAAKYNSDNRSYKSMAGYEVCQYDFRGKQCAVGHCMTEEGRDLAMRQLWEGVEDLGIRLLEGSLKEEYKGHELEFWSDLQRFHDTTQYWRSEGLSLRGEFYKQELLIKYA